MKEKREKEIIVKYIEGRVYLMPGPRRDKNETVLLRNDKTKLWENNEKNNNK